MNTQPNRRTGEGRSPKELDEGEFPLAENAEKGGGR
jgi:hypothetical protein